MAAGVWFVINTPLGTLFNLGSVGAPIATSKAGKAIQFLLLFDGLGALIIFIAATALGRLGVISVRDVQAARRRENEDRDDQPVHRTVRETPLVQTPLVQTPLVQIPVVTTPAVDTSEVRIPTRTTEPITRTSPAVGGAMPPAPPRGGATRLDTNQHHPHDAGGTAWPDRSN